MLGLIKRILLPVSLSTLALSGCASVGPSHVGAPPLAEESSKELSDEVRLGRDMAAVLLGRLGAYRDDTAAVEYVNLVGQSLAQQAGRPEVVFRFAILDSDAVDSFSTPGGYVFVTKGLLAALEKEAELAAFLAHEIAHVNAQHVYLRTRDADTGVALLVDTGLPRELESQADETGSQYLASAGYDAVALATVFKRLLKADGRASAGKSLAGMYERVTRLDQFLAKHELGEPAIADAGVMDARFQRSLSSIQKR